MLSRQFSTEKNKKEEKIMAFQDYVDSLKEELEELLEGDKRFALVNLWRNIDHVNPVQYSSISLIFNANSPSASTWVSSSM